jgi:hypothetical protein
MRTDPALRQRYPADQVHGGYTIPTLSGQPQNAPAVTQASGAMTRLLAGLFGGGSPDEANVQPGGRVAKGGPTAQAIINDFYVYHEGDLFNPGATNYVFEPPFELPLVTIWGKAFLRTPNTFSPRQPEQTASVPRVFTNGLGGVVAGQIVLQGLEQVSE